MRVFGPLTWDISCVVFLMNRDFESRFLERVTLTQMRC